MSIICIYLIFKTMKQYWEKRDQGLEVVRWVDLVEKSSEEHLLKVWKPHGRVSIASW